MQKAKIWETVDESLDEPVGEKHHHETAECQATDVVKSTKENTDQFRLGNEQKEFSFIAAFSSNDNLKTV